MTWTWFEKVFGSRIIDELETERARGDEAVSSLGEAYKTIKENDKALKAFDTAVQEYMIRTAALEEKVKDLTEDGEYYKGQSEALKEMLAASISIPDISVLLEGAAWGIVEPYQHPELGRVHNRKMVYDLEGGDLQYETWPKNVWLSLIEAIQPEVKRVLGKPKFPVNDCENFAATMVNFMAHAFRKAGLSRQGAVFIAWGYKHAYCGFVDLEGRAWIFDPMLDNYMVGELGQPLGEMYVTKDIWFQG